VASKEKPVLLEVGQREVRVSSPSKLYFPDAGVTKLDLVRYYMAIGDGALRGIRNRPIVLKRFVHGITGDFFFQKRAPNKKPDWVHTVQLKFPSGRSADELVVDELAQLVWMVNLGNIDLNPHPVRADDLDQPDELRIDLDPGPGVSWEQVQRVALSVREVLEENELVAWPKTSGSRGIHVLVRLERRYSFDQLRRAALAVAREVEQRMPGDATSKWWTEARPGVFLDYNQNARDRTVASAYSVRPVPGAWVSAPLSWEEVPNCKLEDFDIRTIPKRFEELGDLHAGIDDAACSLDPLLALVARHEEQGMGDAAWPPHYRKQSGEPERVQPSRKKTPKKKATKKTAKKKGGRVSKMPLLTIAKAKSKDDALAGLERWKARHPQATEHLTVEDVLVDAMRGRSSMWTRVRVNLRNVPEAQRPPEEPADPDYDPWGGQSE
jgi:bifunctional non-homologous end joining protein LigD